MTEEQFRNIQKKAENNGVPIGTYIVRMAIHDENSLTPQLMVRIQTLVNRACESVREYAPDKADEMSKEAAKL